MKMNKTMSGMMAAAAVATLSGCATAPQYKVIERVNADGTVDRVVTEKTFMDKVNDFGTNNQGTLRLLEVGGQYGFGIWEGTRGERTINSINRNTKQGRRDADKISDAIRHIPVLQGGR